MKHASTGFFHRFCVGSNRLLPKIVFGTFVKKILYLKNFPFAYIVRRHKFSDSRVKNIYIYNVDCFSNINI